MACGAGENHGAAVWLGLLAVLLADCGGAAAPAPAAADAAALPAPSLPKPAEPAAAPRLIPAAEGEVAALVREEQGRGAGLVLVYVGAPWCEPCRAFHDALVAGDFDATLAGVRFLEFNLDRDRDRLAAAGYTSRYIPLFAVPEGSGRASGRQVEGGVKGPGAAQYVVGRLVPLIEASRTRP